jgi:hypothetical protein
MAQPTWVTGSGSLGTIPEGKFYRASIEAFDPDFPSDLTKVKYTKLSGTLPRGIQIHSNGTVEGTPIASVQGIPLPVTSNVTSTFAVRVYTEKIVNGIIIPNNISDRTFTLTITGQDAPEFITNAGSLGDFFDGQLVDTKIEFTDPDPGDTVTVSLINGELPPGVTLSEKGAIYGFISPSANYNSATTGWGNEAWDAYPMQFNTGTVSKTYEFTLKITDGTNYNMRTFGIFVGIITVDATKYTVDSGIITTDIVTQSPFILDYVYDLGVFKHDNFFIHQFKGIDYNGDKLNYTKGTSGTADSSIISADSETSVKLDYVAMLPSGLTLDVDTGVMYGTLSNIGLTEQDHTFSISVYKKENPLITNTFYFKMKVIGDLNIGIKWDTNSELGTINNGDVSTMNISAISNSGVHLQYRLKSGGVYNKLPQGLSLLPSGNVVGKVAYQTFSLIDHNITSDSISTSDTNLINASINGNNTITFDKNITTFDNKFVFTVEAYSANNLISTFKTFTINVHRKYNLPSHELVIDSLLSYDSRALLDELLQNQDIIKQELLYRPDDMYFGVSDRISYTHAYGLSPEMISTYTESLKFNHYNKQPTIGKIKTAQSLNEDGSVQYEVVYCDIIDDNHGISQTINTTVGGVYPNSFDNMRNHVIDKVGQISTKLPSWMLSKQDDATILGFTTAWVIAYTLPRQAKLVAYNIDKQFGSQLNKIDFRVDRYTLKSQFAQNWDAEDQRWYPTDSTSFDVYNHGISSTSTGTSTDTSGVTVDLSNSKTVETVFDKRSCGFIDLRNNKTDISTKTADTINISVDNGIKNTITTHEIIEKFDKYLIFPNRDIINTK